MIFVNEATKQEVLPKNLMRQFIIILSPFAPHIAEELWSRLGNNKSLFESAQWVKYDEALIVQNFVEVVAQVNGKIRAKFRTLLDTPEEQLKKLALAEPNMKIHVDGKHIIKEIIVKNKLVNIVVK